MRAPVQSLTLNAAFLGVLAACEPVGGQAGQAPFAPSYDGVKTVFLANDLVGIHVAMRGARTNGDVADYAECAAAQYALNRGYGFARHVRTKVDDKAGVWTADAVYTISPSLPRGLKTIDAEVTVENCVETGIPTL